MNEASETYPNSRDTWHVALQPLAACGFQCVRPKPDDSHSTVWWNAGTRRFLGRRFEGRQLALDVADLKIVLIEDDDALDGFSVVGLTKKRPRCCSASKFRFAKTRCHARPTICLRCR